MKHINLQSFFKNSPSKAALIMSLDSVFTVLGAFLTLCEILSYTELFGCFLILSAAVICSLFADSNAVITADIDGTVENIIVVESTDRITELKEFHHKDSDDQIPSKGPSISDGKSIYDYSAVNIHDTDDNCERKI